MRKRYLVIVFLVLCFSNVSGCVRKIPTSFTSTGASSWMMIELRDDLEYNEAWNKVIELLVQNFVIDKAMREEGYIQTDWLYSWAGEYLSTYRVRLILKFSADRTKLQFKPEAQALFGKDWKLGVDTRLVSTIKTDLMGTVARITR